jgi:hypothetical protein
VAQVAPEQEVPASPVACLSAFPASARARRTCARPTDTAARRRGHLVQAKARRRRIVVRRQVLCPNCGPIVLHAAQGERARPST